MWVCVWMGVDADMVVDGFGWMWLCLWSVGVDLALFIPAHPVSSAKTCRSPYRCADVR